MSYKSRLVVKLLLTFIAFKFFPFHVLFSWRWICKFVAQTANCIPNLKAVQQLLPTDGMFLLRPLVTSPRRSKKMLWRRTTETSWQRSTETLLSVSFETQLRRCWDVQQDVITTLLPHPVASQEYCFKPSFERRKHSGWKIY